MIKKLAINFSSLSLLQLSNYIFPLIVFPYLVRVLGPEKYGLVNFAFAFTVYFISIIDYGFSLSATREIAVKKGNKEILNEIFNSTFFSKLLLLVPVTVIYFLLAFYIDFFSQDLLLYIVVYFSIIGKLLFPGWFYLGLEKMHFIAVFNIIIRAFSVTAIYIFVSESKDVILYAVILSSYQLLLGITGIIHTVASGLTKVYYPGIPSVINRIKMGFSIFSSSFAIMLYTTSNTFVLGVISGNTAVGFFTGVDKIRLALQNIGGIAGQTIYPHITNLFTQSKNYAKSFLLKYGIIFGSLFILFAVSMSFLSDFVINLVLGEDFSEASNILIVLSFLPFIILLSNIFGIQIMLSQGFDKAFNKIIVTAALINIILLLILVPVYDGLGAAVSMLITEIFVTIAVVIFVIRKKILTNEI